KRTLVEWCRTFCLPVSGRKEDLKARLYEFSKDETKWDWVIPGARCNHRGPRTGRITKSSSKKQSIREVPSVTPITHPPLRLPTQTFQHTPVAQHESILDWVSFLLFLKHPYMSKEAQMEAAQARLNHVAAQHHVVVVTPPFVSAASLLNPLAAPSTSPPQLPDHQDPSSLCSIMIAKGKVLNFTPADCPPPPAITFAEDIVGLNCMWDDTSIHWGGHSALHIKGVPVAIVYWNEVYGSTKSGPWKSKQWKGAKGAYNKWKRWRQTSEEDFWKEFSDNKGVHMTYTAITSRLAALHAVEDCALTERAKEEYRDSFGKVFAYLLNGGVRVKSKPCDIAKQYHKLKGIME
ncbi:hypothetical protein BYT27DRAFT_7099857, partial [Phlegmacium glaucopus]